ncbi:TPA: hypothetical protein TUV01_001254 [Streptococcus equi subsp. zooepidemicus]|nr:hypothetical protein [Streptococcus equi subsp. zooepidemicus]
MNYFIYSDKQLNVFNRGKHVYSVSEDYANRYDYDLIVDKPDNQLRSGEINRITVDNQDFQVIKTYSDPKTGFDGMAVAPIIDDKIDLKHVAVVAAGTDPNAKDLKLRIANASPVGMEPMVATVTISQDLVSAGLAKYTNLSPQYKSLETFIETVQDLPDVRISQLTGYSQGAYVTKAGAKYHIPATTFNAWFNYHALTTEELAFLKKNPHMFISYRKKNDTVTSYNDVNKPWKYYDDYGTIHWIEGKSHSISDWYFDLRTGAVLSKKNGDIVVNEYSRIYSHAVQGMTHLKSLKAHWQSTGKGISSSEELFLDAAQGMILGSSMAKAAREGADEALDHKTVADAKLMEVWSAIDFNSFHELPYYEVQALFSSYGITYDRFVQDFQDYTQSKVSKMSALATDFENLNRDIQTVIDSKLETDRQLAGEFRAWQTEL